MDNSEISLNIDHCKYFEYQYQDDLDSSRDISVIRSAIYSNYEDAIIVGRAVTEFTNQFISDGTRYKISIIPLGQDKYITIITVAIRPHAKL